MAASLALPILHVSADRAAEGFQRRYFRQVALRLVSLVLAAVAGALTVRFGSTETDWAGVVGGGAFITAILTELHLLRTRPDRSWFQARSTAESVKTLAWRFAVRGKPFDSADESAVEKLFSERLVAFLTDAQWSAPIAPDDPTGSAVTADMREARAMGLGDRQGLYLEGRLDDQAQWYADRTRHHEAQGARWTAAIVLAEFAGAAGALVKSVGLAEIDLLGMFAALAAAVSAWLGARHHLRLASAYSRTSHELLVIKSKLATVNSEQEWAEYVDEAEEAISREHTLWIASHSS